jgi:hypothetical protein
MFSEGSTISATAVPRELAPGAGAAESAALDAASAPWSSEATNLHPGPPTVTAQRTVAPASILHALDIGMTLDSK